MAYYNLKKRLLIFDSGREVKITGLSIGATPDLQMGEVYSPNVLDYAEYSAAKKGVDKMINPLGLSYEEFDELLDLQIQSCLDCKKRIRQTLKHSVPDPSLKKP